MNNIKDQGIEEMEKAAARIAHERVYGIPQEEGGKEEKAESKPAKAKKTRRYSGKK